MTYVMHNMTAMNTQRQYGINTNIKAKTIEKLSSGYRINRAADDAAGLAISEKMRSQIRGLIKGVQNTEEGVSLCHVADGVLSEVSAMLHRMKELAVQSANGTNADDDRGNLQDEVSQLLEEIDRISEDTEFNTMRIFKESTVAVEREKVHGTIVNMGTSKWILPDIIKEEKFSLEYTGFRNTTAIFDGVEYRRGEMITGTWLTFGEQGHRRNSSDTYNLYTSYTVLGATMSMKSEEQADMASEMVIYAKVNILEQTGQAMMAQANQSKQGVLQLLSLA